MDKSGFIYFIAEDSDDRFIKIGKTKKSPNKRLAMLQTGNPRKLILIAAYEVDNCDYYEPLLHKAFNFGRTTGEWFRRGEKVNYFIEFANEQGFYKAAVRFVDRIEALLIAERHGIDANKHWQFKQLIPPHLTHLGFKMSNEYLAKQRFP